MTVLFLEKPLRWEQSISDQLWLLILNAQAKLSIWKSPVCFLALTLVMGIEMMCAGFWVARTVCKEMGAMFGRFWWQQKAMSVKRMASNTKYPRCLQYPEDVSRKCAFSSQVWPMAIDQVYARIVLAIVSFVQSYLSELKVFEHRFSSSAFPF
ncbi:hypothetical protein V6N13_013479 [Hibiscus sabdariffa]